MARQSPAHSTTCYGSSRRPRPCALSLSRSVRVLSACKDARYTSQPSQSERRDLGAGSVETRRDTGSTVQGSLDRNGYFARMLLW